VPRRYNEEADELAKIVRADHRPPERFCPRYRSTLGRPRASPLEPRGTRGGFLESNKRGAHGRGPLERGVRAIPPRGVWRLRG
jgi:hypothetical protein